MAMAAPPRCFFSYAVHQTLSLGPLYSDGPLSSQAQPRGSDGDVTPRKDTREDFGPHFSCRQVLMKGGFNAMPQGMCQPVSLRKVQQDCSDCSGHRSKTRWWGNSAGELERGRGPTG